MNTPGIGRARLSSAGRGPLDIGLSKLAQVLGHLGFSAVRLILNRSGFRRRLAEDRRALPITLWAVLMCIWLVSASAEATESTNLVPHISTNSVVLTPAYLAALVEQMRTNQPALLAAGKRNQSTQANAAAVRS